MCRSNAEARGWHSMQSRLVSRTCAAVTLATEVAGRCGAPREQNIGGLDVEVDDALVVQVRQPARGVQRHLHAPAPGSGPRQCSATGCASCWSHT